MLAEWPCESSEHATAGPWRVETRISEGGLVATARELTTDFTDAHGLRTIVIRLGGPPGSEDGLANPCPSV